MLGKARFSFPGIFLEGMYSTKSQCTRWVDGLQPLRLLQFEYSDGEAVCLLKISFYLICLI